MYKKKLGKKPGLLPGKRKKQERKKMCNSAKLREIRRLRAVVRDLETQIKKLQSERNVLRGALQVFAK